MRCRFFLPPPELRPYIRAYLWYHNKTNGRTQPIKFLPSGFPYLIFNLGDPFLVHNQSHPRGRNDGGNQLVGQQESYYLLTPGEEYSHFCIIFQPGGLSRLMGLPVHELLNDAASLGDFTTTTLEEVFDRFREGLLSPGQLLRRVNGWFHQRLLYCRNDYLYVEYTLDHIRQRNGLVSVEELAVLSNTCTRNYRRRFLEITGIAPKKFLLITRLRKILSSLECNEPLPVDWSEIVYRSGYYDQMHFIKEFKKFCGETPSAYLDDYRGSRQLLERYLLSLVD